MACIRVRFIACKGFIGWGIRATCNSLFEHVEYGTPEGTWLGAHAGQGIAERPANYCTCTREYVYEIPCPQFMSDELMKWARAQIGTKYNYSDILGLLFKNRKIDTPGRMICSQFVTTGLLKVFGSGEILNVLPEFAYLVTPETLHLSPIFVGHLVKKIP